MQFLGKGSWNCAHFDELRKDVLRVGYVFDKFILRGVWMVDFLQPFFNLLGPSLIKQTGPPSVMDYKHVPDEIKRNWCDALNKRNDLQIVMQRTELLYPRGTYSDFVAFSLIWFLVMAQEKLGFKHGDIKRANVMFRKYPTKQVFKFFLDEKHKFMFSSNEAPVFIDFDFSSTNVTQTRLNPGTAYTAPPEAIMYYLKMTTVPFDVMVYDWWSLGIYFIELVAPFQVSTIMQEEIVAYILHHFPGKNVVALNGFYVGILLNQALGYDTLPANWNHMFPSRSLFESPNFETLKERLNKAIEKHSGLMYLLKYHLLTLYSDRRRQGRKYLLHFRPEVINKRPNFIYSASIDIREKATQYSNMWYLQNCIECREKPAKWQERMDSTKKFCSQLCQIGHYTSEEEEVRLLASDGETKISLTLDQAEEMKAIVSGERGDLPTIIPGETLLEIKEFLDTNDVAGPKDLSQLLVAADFLGFERLIYHLMPKWVNDKELFPNPPQLDIYVPKAWYFYEGTDLKGPFQDFIRIEGPKQWAIRVAAENGELEVVNRLLQDTRVDPSTNLNDPIVQAAKYGHVEVVDRLLQDPRVNPGDGRSLAFILAAQNGHIQVVNRLLQDSRVNPSTNDDMAIIEAASSGHLEVVDRLLQVDGVDPAAQNNAAIRKASIRGHLKVVDRLLQDSRVDPRAEDDFAVKRALLFNHLDVVERLMQDPRMKSVNLNEIGFN